MTTLFVNTVLRTFSCSPKRMIDSNRLDFVCSCGLHLGHNRLVLYDCILHASRTLFQNYYGVGLRRKCSTFFEATAYLRKSDFGGFVVSLIAFRVTFTLSLFVNYEGKFCWGMYYTICSPILSRFLVAMVHYY